MAEAVFSIPITGTIEIDGNTLTIKVKESALTFKLEGALTDNRKRLQLKPGQTLFDVVLESARDFMTETGEKEFSAADLYHVATTTHPELNLKQNTWNSHIVSSSPNHPSYRHYTAKRRYFHYLGGGKYSLEPNIDLEVPPLRINSRKTKLHKEE